MKNLFFAMAFCCCAIIVNAQSAANAPAATLQDSHHAIINYVKGNGSIYNKDNVLVCQIQTNGTILDGNSKPMGYITMHSTIEDANHKTIGYMNGSYFEDVNHKHIGSVLSDGSIRTDDNIIVGYEEGTEPMWAGLYFFIFKK